MDLSVMSRDDQFTITQRALASEAMRSFSLRGEIEKLQATVTELRSQLGNQPEKLKGLEKEMVQLVARVTKAERSSAEAIARAEAAEKRADAAEQLAEASDEQVAEKDQRIAQQERQIQRLQLQLHAAQRQLKAFQEQYGVERGQVLKSLSMLRQSHLASQRQY